jgi:hypothetical protein
VEGRKNLQNPTTTCKLFFRRDQKAADKNIGASGGDGDNRKFRVSSGAKAPFGEFAECRS